jgi:hypothetical protein
MKFFPEIKTKLKELIVNRIIKGYVDVPTLTKMINTFFLFDTNEFFNYQNELLQSRLLDKLRNDEQNFYQNTKGKTYRGNDYVFGGIKETEAIQLYCIIRKVRPEILVETGVCNGTSTAVILSALKKNGQGKLYSIDFPEVAGLAYDKQPFWTGKGGAAIPGNTTPGWIIPPELKTGWELIIGKSDESLEPLLEKLHWIDFFLHDSEHSYPCMIYEFNLAFQFLKKDGFLFSHDIHINKAFFDFVEKNQTKLKTISLNNIGVIQKL